MNEQQTAYAIARQLDQTTDQLPDHVIQRLDQARSEAMAAYPEELSSQRSPKKSKRWLDFDTPSLMSRAAFAVVPLAVITAGLIGLSQWNQTNPSIEMAGLDLQVAELDTEVVLDDLPLAALTDQGFGVFLKNTRQ